MLLSLNKNFKNILGYAAFIIALFLLFKFLVFIVPIAAIVWGTYKIAAFSRGKLKAIKINRISGINRKKNIGRSSHMNYEEIFKPTDFQKQNSFVDVEYEEVRR